MFLKKNQFPILFFTIGYMIVFGLLYALRLNFEFLIYVVVLLVLGGIILFSNKALQYRNSTLWLLSIWGLLHMAAGMIPIGTGVLYGWMVIPITENILRFDQLVHVFGFFVATLVLADVMDPIISRKHMIRWSTLLVMGGLGLGAMNEIVEFIATLILPSTGVGGYVNTGFDLIADLIGSLLALFVVWKRK